MDLLYCSSKFFRRVDVGPEELGAAKHPLRNPRVSKAIKHMPSIPSFNHHPVGPKDRKLLRDTAVRGSKRLSKTVYVDLTDAKLLNDANTIGVRENSEEFGELLAYEYPSRHTVT